MSSIQPKKGQCIDCELGPEKPLIGKRCQFHYWKYRNQLKTADRKAKGLDIDKQAQKKALDLWYASQISKMPKACENCNEPLIMFAPWAARAYVAHILPKRNFESVKTHPMNRLFLCIQCHGDYDNRGWEKSCTMNVFKIAVDRLRSIIFDVCKDELNKMPGCIIEALNE